MANPILTEGIRLSDVVKYEEGGQNYYSREAGTLTSGQSVVLGEVLQISGGKYLAMTADTDTAVAVALETVDATGGDAPILVLVRDAIVAGDSLTNGGTSTLAANSVELEAVGILVRDQIPASSVTIAGSAI